MSAEGYQSQLFQVANWPALPEDLSAPEHPEMGHFARQAREWMRQLTMILDQTLLAGGSIAAESSDALKNYPYPPGAVIYADADGALAGNATALSWVASVLTAQGTLDVWANTYAASSLSVYTSAWAFHRPDLYLQRARGTRAAPTAIASGDTIGIFGFKGHDGTAFQAGPYILAYSSEAWDATHRGAYLRIYSGSTGTGMTEAMQIWATGARMAAGSAAAPSISGIVDPDTGPFWAAENVYAFSAGAAEIARVTAGGFMPATASGKNLGSTALEWANVYIGTGRAYFGAGQNASVYFDGTDLVLG